MNLGDMKRELQRLKDKVGKKNLNSKIHLQPKGMNLQEWEGVIAEHKPDGRRHFWVSFVEPKDMLTGSKP